ncbi:TetR/AcrR family transcriptional regulator [Enterovirga sp. CN4-39]|uniref:TetR/AcrR family transcriptional regulator n=1 Tax=Enterovirga sp. CN4-39 TaxID=3400910 RepID=UPI003C06B845
MLQANQNGVDRRTRILDAAETCFVRSGFHRTTMQDVAAEAGMSAGNLYRYFPSKDAIVAGLSERDRREVAESFAIMDQAGRDFMAGFAELGRRHFEDEPREKAVLCLEIWCEATRNPACAKLTADFANEVVERLTTLLDAAAAAGNISPAMDTRTIATLICTLADGVMVRRATLPDYEPAREIPAIMHLICALVSGAVPAVCATQPEKVRP